MARRPAPTLTRVFACADRRANTKSGVNKIMVKRARRTSQSATRNTRGRTRPHSPVNAARPAFPPCVSALWATEAHCPTMKVMMTHTAPGRRRPQ